MVLRHSFAMPDVGFGLPLRRLARQEGPTSGNPIPRKFVRIGGSRQRMSSRTAKARMKESCRDLLKIVLGLCCSFALVGVMFAQRPFREYPSVEYGESTPLPPDWQRPGEWSFARLMYPPGPNDGYHGRFDGDWRLGFSLWTQDGPPADRNFAAAVRRLTRIDARSVEQDVNLDDGDEVYNWPWLYAVQVGEWGITQHQADVLRDYLLRGGFLMADDFHGAYEWQMFEKRIRMVFPDRPIVEIPDNDPIFHTLYDLDDRYQIPGAAHLRLG